MTKKLGDGPEKKKFWKQSNSNLYIIRLPKQSSFIQYQRIYPIFWTQIELLSHFNQKSCFVFPFLPPISRHKSTYRVFLAKRRPIVSLELHFVAACQF